MLRVLQATAWYPPVHLGGTEVYLTGLVRELRAHDVDSTVIAPLAPALADGYQFDGAIVRCYSVNETPSRAELRGEIPHHGFSRFSSLLSEEHPNIYHQHSWSRGLGGAHLHAAREAGLKTVLTIHVPNNFCMRGTMMRFGEHPCDGRIDPPICGACWSHGRGAPRAIAHMLGAVPSGVANSIERFSCAAESRLATALSARALGERRRKEFVRMAADADRLVVVSNWLQEVLLLNGVPQEKVVLSRHGVDHDFVAAATRVNTLPHDNMDGPFRLVYLGRWDPAKGIDVLVRAVRNTPRAPISLSIYGVGDGPDERAYAKTVCRLADGDQRIAIKAPVTRDQVATTLADADALAVPSLCLETGPLVVVEAKAVGVPIIGSRLGGIAELVREPDDGVLVAPGDVAAWSEAIERMASTRKVASHRSVAAQVRTMRDVADDMAALYRSLS